MITLLAAAIGALGLISMISRKTLLGLLVGGQLLVIGSSMIFVFAGTLSGAELHGQLGGLFVILGGVAQLVTGYAFAVRMFYLNKKIGMEDLRSLKQ